ncbi:MAG: DUF1592 domain-containing protein, partial [Bdellovibrionales bacterium]|nr:DUF1592 domain-containing protein [Bdellovibrionales bacterium]
LSERYKLGGDLNISIRTILKIVILSLIVMLYHNCAPFKPTEIVGSETSGSTSPNPVPPIVDMGSKLSFNSDFGKEAKSILVRNCAGCHGVPTDGVGGVSDILNANSLVQTGLVVPGEPENSRLYQSILKGRMPKTGPMSEVEIEKIYYWIRGLEVSNGTCLPKEVEISRVPKTRMWRMSRRQIINTIVDTFGSIYNTQSLIEYDTKVSGFANDESVNQVREQYARGIQAFAEAASINIAAVEKSKVNLDSSADMRSYLESKALMLFRRPITSSELDTYMNLYAVGDTNLEGLELVLQALLQSPNFWYHQELGSKSPYKWYNLASRISFSIINRIPDDELFALAKSGALSNNSVLQGQIERLLNDERASDNLTQFVTQWFDIYSISGQTFNSDVVDKGTVSQSMIEETKRFVDHVIRNKGSKLENLFTSQTTFINKDLAQFYKSSAATSTSYIEHQMDGVSRSGIMTLPGVVASISTSENAYIHRGIFVRQNLLCQFLPPPPDVQFEPISGPLPTDPRLLAQIHAKNPVCNTCHSMIDPIGFSYSNYDENGLFSPFNTGKTEDNTGKLRLTIDADGDYQGVGVLSQALGKSRDVQLCSSERMFQFLLGRSPSAQDQCEVTKINQKYKDSGFSLKSLLKAYLESDLLLKREQ